MSRFLASHFVPLPVSITMVLRCACTSSEFARIWMRLRSSGGDFFSQNTLGTTPNIAPPSRRKPPPSRYRISMSPMCMDKNGGFCRDDFPRPSAFEWREPGGPPLEALQNRFCSSQNFRNRGERIFLARGDLFGKRVEAFLAPLAAQNFFEEARFQHFDQAAFPELDVLLPSLAAGFEMSAEFFHSHGELLDAFIFRGHGADHGWMPAVARHHERKHGVELLLETVGAFAVGFVEHKNVADFHQTGFHVLDVVPETGNQHHQYAVGKAHNVNFILADADGLDQHLALSCRIEQQRDFRC